MGRIRSCGNSIPRPRRRFWLYGEHQEQGKGDLWDRLDTPVRGFRYGINERGGGVTIIVDERARIFAVNRDKELVWDLGGSSGGDLLIATPYIILPTYISATTRGTLLVTDWGRNMIYEINPFHIPQRTEEGRIPVHGLLRPPMSSRTAVS